MPKRPSKVPQTNVKKIGQATALKMKSKLDKLKQNKVSKDEEIESESDSGKPHKETFLVGMEDDEMVPVETVEEKRLKMTK